MPELSNAQLEEMVVGKPQRGTAEFFEKAALDVAESNKQGRRVYSTEVYVMVRQSGVRDAISYKATPEDFREYPAEWERFQNNRQGTKQSPKIDIIPGLQLVHMQELIDMGMSTIESLANTVKVPDHLEYARQSAIMLNHVLEEQYASQEKDQREEESSAPEGVSASGRPEHADRVRRSPLQGSGGDHRRETEEGLRPSGQEHHRQGVNTLDNWKFEFKL